MIDLPHISNGDFKGACRPGRSGQNCVYFCDSGYALNGNPIFNCQKNGQWDKFDAPTCAQVFCNSLLHIENAEFSGKYFII